MKIFTAILVLGIICSTSLSAQEKKIVVILDRQVIEAYEGYTKVKSVDCVTGKDSSTRIGTFRVEYHGDINYVSKKYEVPMPYPLFFDNGRAIHATSFVTIRSYSKWLGLNGVGTHGCVGVSESDAKWFYNWASDGTIISVISE